MRGARKRMKSTLPFVEAFRRRSGNNTLLRMLLHFESHRHICPVRPGCERFMVVSEAVYIPLADFVGKSCHGFRIEGVTPVLGSLWGNERCTAPKVTK